MLTLQSLCCLSDNPLGNGQLHPYSEYESLPRGASMGGPHLFGVFFVDLRRETNGFGFKLLGGSEEGTQVCESFKFLWGYETTTGRCFMSDYI